MALIQFGGVSSGLDTAGIVNALVDAAAGPLRRVQAEQTSIKARQTAYGKLEALLATFLAKAKAFTVGLSGAGRTASFSSNAIGVAATAGAVPATYQVSVERLASATRATSVGGIGTAVTAATAGDPVADLPLAGTVTAGSIGLVVDGTIVHLAVGDPATTSLTDVLDSIAAAVEARVRATPGDEAATVSASVVGNRIQVSVSGASSAHAVSFGVAGDTSNALTILGLRGLSGSLTDAAPISTSSALGVVRASQPLDAAGLAGLASTTTGSIRINGVEIAYDSSVDSLSTVLARINASSAGVVASLDRSNDAVVLTSRTAGAAALDLADTSGTLLASLGLAPGTTAAQALGQGSRIWVDGRLVESDTNEVSTAISGVTLSLRSTTAAADTLTVGLDTASVKTALADLVKAYNALADQLDTDTANAAKGSRGPLATEIGARNLSIELRSLLLRAAPGLSGTLTSLGAIGVSTGVVGSAAGATTRLVLDEGKLAKALAADPDGVARLLDSAEGALAPVVARINALTRSDGAIKAAKTTLADQLRLLVRREGELQDRLDKHRATLDRKYAALESQLSLMQSQSSQLAAQTSALTASRQNNR